MSLGLGGMSIAKRRERRIVRREMEVFSAGKFLKAMQYIRGCLAFISEEALVRNGEVSIFVNDEQVIFRDLL